MHTVRKTLTKLGWPLTRMTDRQITQELYRRWFVSQAKDTERVGPLSVASVRGIVASMAAEGNLDALCWSKRDRAPETDVLSDEDRVFYDRPETPERTPVERRRSRREVARDLVRWCLSGEEAVDCTGWLINRSAEGMAFIASAGEAPAVGDEIVSSVHSRTQGIIETGPARIVRIEPLNEQLTLVCARLAETA